MSSSSCLICLHCLSLLLRWMMSCTQILCCWTVYCEPDAAPPTATYVSARLHYISTTYIICTITPNSPPNTEHQKLTTLTPTWQHNLYTLHTHAHECPKCNVMWYEKCTKHQTTTHLARDQAKNTRSTRTLCIPIDHRRTVLSATEVKTHHYKRFFL